VTVISLDGILDLLGKHHQRATYGAVASLLGKSPRALLQGRKRDWRHSWIVNKTTGLPSEYPAGMVHPSIREREEVLDSAEDLKAWLENPN
jgi:hypothetical protein